VACRSSIAAPRPGLAAFRLGHAALTRQPLAELARPAMQALATDFPGAASLGVRQDFEMLYVKRVDGGPAIYPGLRVGSQVTLIASAMG
jgi:DNA-binding IclR family transcriptional regulator